MKIKRIVAMAMATVLTVSAMSISAFAVVEDKGYLYADTLSLSQTVTSDSLTSAKDEHWYKFTISDPNAAYSLSLYNAPSTGAYSYELRYQEATNSRPIIVENEPVITSAGKVNMMGVLKNAGTYYVRVYSLTGAYSSSAYTFKISVGYGSHGLTINTSSADSDYDWAVCATMMGSTVYNRKFGVYPSRTYMNATKFISTNGAKEKATSPVSMTRPDIDNTAVAANYIFSGDYMDQPTFEVKNQLLDYPDFLDLIWSTTEKRRGNPVIIQLVDTDYPNIPGLWRYYLVRSVNVSDEYITTVNPSTGGSKTFDLETLYLGGDSAYNNLRYTGNNIICNE